ncbi:hypothetical protein MYRNA_14 [Mycobacterium phage Myrna]|uniref:Uncharacterized protein n=1 Tax=Mycobacterium phage Myrna TaxID=546805 RepID=B5LJ25_9CAUD|nr:gp14 [Mycobacterium phage Myrna]ACH62022.1 hypothetical protein MYRNA_14 [Mycobacterium phage Myrna]
MSEIRFPAAMGGRQLVVRHTEGEGISFALDGMPFGVGDDEAKQIAAFIWENVR